MRVTQSDFGMVRHGAPQRIYGCKICFTTASHVDMSDAYASSRTCEGSREVVASAARRPHDAANFMAIVVVILSPPWIWISSHGARRGCRCGGAILSAPGGLGATRPLNMTPMPCVADTSEIAPSLSNIPDTWRPSEDSL
jgi:hypothetical protein